jgi:DNA-binding MarR family transcriptional regulator
MPKPLGQLLHAAAVAAEHELDRRLRQGKFGDIRPAHYVVFQVLSKTGDRLTELAAKANMTKQSMQYLVDHLEAAGYLQKSPDAGDKRSQIIHATDRARRLGEMIAKITADIETDWAARMGQGDFGTLKRLLARLHHSLKGA